MITRMRKSLTLKWMIFSILLVTIPLTLVALGILQIYHLDLKGSFIAMEGIILIIAVLFSLFFTRQLTLPIKQLSREMEEGVNTSQIHLVDAMDMARIAYWEFDLKTGQFIFDDAFYTLYGTTAEAEGGYRIAAEDYFQRFIHPDDLPIARQSAEESLQAPGPEYISQLEHRAIHRNGEIRYFLVRSRTLKDASGNITRSFGANQDITERKRMEEELAQKTRELETLYDLSLLINQSLDIDTVFHTALEKALSVTGFEMGAIFLLNDTGDVLERKSQIGIPPTIFEDGKILKYGEGVSGNTLVSKQPVVASINEYSSYRKAPALIKEGIQTLVGLPLVSKGKAIGTITLLSHSPRELSQREINLLENIGNQIGIALENAKLYSNVAKAKSEWETTFDAVMEGIIIIDKNYRIMHANKDAHERIGLEPKDLIGKKCFEAFEHNDKPCDGCCVAETFATKKSAFLERKNQNTKRIIRLRAFPIFDESGESVGAVELISDITEEKRLEMEKEVVNNVNRIIASSLDVKRVIRAVRTELNRVLDSERMSITLLDEKGEGFQIFALEKDYDGKELAEGIVYPLKGTPFEKVAERGLPIITMDITESDSWTSKELLKEGICSSLVFPLEYKGKVIGTLNFGSKKTNHFSEDQFSLLRQIAPGLAISIQNALLFEETKKRLNELTILYEIMKISVSSLSLDQMLREIMDSLRIFFKFETLGILLVDENTKRLFPHPASYNELSMKNIGKLGLCVGKGITGWVAEKGEPLLVNDVSKDSRYVCGDESACSEICVPLKMGEKVIGVIDSQSRNLNDFSVDDLRLLSIVGGQLATLIENLRLYEEIKQSEEKYRTVIEGVREGVAVLGTDFKFRYANKRLSEILGYSKEELTGMDFRNILTEKSQKNVVDRYVKWIRKEEDTPHFKFDILRKDKEIRNMEISTKEMRDSAGNLTFVASMRDVTEKKKMEDQLLQAEKLRALSEMASGVAHDFNNALAVILGNTQLLLYDAQDEESKKSLKTIEKVAKDSAQTVRRLQDFTRKRTYQELLNVDVNSVIKDCIEITKPKWKDEVQRRGILIEIVSNLEKIPSVLGNASELREVITNMIFNAIEAMPEGGKIQIRTYQKRKQVFIQISDTGIGIAEEVRKKIFEPFFTTKPFTNTGLGLSMSYGIIKRLGGEFEVESKVGRGTVFTIILPIGGEQREEAVPSLTIKKRRRAHILVIDDEEFVRSVLSRTLAQVNHQVTLAENGEKGIQLFKEREFDMVLTDLGMPGMSGWEVCRMIKEISPNTPIGMITGWGMEMNRDKMEEYGPNFIISKPFDLNQILNVVAENIEPKEERFFS